MMSRFGGPWKRDTRYTQRPGSYAVLLRDDRILLTSQVSPEPEFQLPGGGIDPGESPIAALHREVIEETGWRIKPVRRLGTYRRHVFMADYDIMAEKICHVYLAWPVHKICAPTDVAHEPFWTTPAQAIRLLAGDGDRAVMRALIGQGAENSRKRADISSGKSLLRAKLFRSHNMASKKAVPGSS